VRHIYRQTQGKLPIIGVGGIFNAADAWEKITAGASLIQVYTGMVYEGPGIARAIVSGLQQRLEQAGMAELREAVGTGSSLGSQDGRPSARREGGP
jgi:dihydroorotate dehydrogenase